MRFIRYMGMGAVALAVGAPGGAMAALDTWADDTGAPWAVFAVPAVLAVPAQAVRALPAFRPGLAWSEAQQDPAEQDAGGAAGFTVPVALALLEQARGGADTVSNDARLSGIVSGNAAINVVTGSNAIEGASFSNASGIPIVIQNTGANVLIQNATIVNLQLR